MIKYLIYNYNYIHILKSLKTTTFTTKYDIKVMKKVKSKEINTKRMFQYWSFVDKNVINWQKQNIRLEEIG